MEKQEYIVLRVSPYAIGVGLPSEVRKDVSLTVMTDQDTEGDPYPLVSVQGVTHDDGPIVAKVAHWQPNVTLLQGYPSIPATAVIRAFDGEMRLMRLVIAGEYSVSGATNEWLVAERSS